MSIADNIARVEEQIEAACRAAGRAREYVQLMAVSKKHSVASILEAYRAGLRVFGENRVQEFESKQPELLASGIASTSFHCIGPLQSNKSARAAQLFDAIDTVDSLRLAEKLNQSAAEANKILPICIQIKLSLEDSKHGFDPDSAELDQLLERLPDLSHLRLRGLMTIPPFEDDPEQVRPYFRRLRALRDSLTQSHPHLSFDELSMGMSHDFSVAIKEGATSVRIGTAIFGTRPSQ